MPGGGRQLIRSSRRQSVFPIVRLHPSPPKAWMNDIHCAGEAGWQSASKATVDSIIFLAIPIAA